MSFCSGEVFGGVLFFRKTLLCLQKGWVNNGDISHILKREFQLGLWSERTFFVSPAQLICLPSYMILYTLSMLFVLRYRMDFNTQEEKR